MDQLGHLISKSKVLYQQYVTAEQNYLQQPTGNNWDEKEVAFDAYCESLLMIKKILHQKNDGHGASDSHSINTDDKNL